MAFGGEARPPDRLRSSAVAWRHAPARAGGPGVGGFVVVRSVISPGARTWPPLCPVLIAHWRLKVSEVPSEHAPSG